MTAADGAAAALASVVEREDAALEARHWVRLTRRCNNRCLFCHDSDRQDGTVVPLDALRADLAEGRRRGATRLVLSGGEPTIHPEVLAVIAAGRAAGYRWVQLVSNGRMFAYDRFTARAVAAGLDEATVSVHGHAAEIHDELVGIPGAFSQTVRGIQNLLAAGRVVSVDVVVTRRNVRHLAELLRRFLALGIREFDLLHLVPFGRAFDEHRDALFYDPAEERAHVLEALALAAQPGVHLWTNRWPAPLLEGAEHLIQDPHKLLDEVRGTREGLEAFLRDGTDPWCRGERCARCFLGPFCDALAAARAALAEGAYPVVAVDAASVPEGAGALRDLARQAGAAYRLRAPDAAAAAALLARLPRGDAAPLELDLEAPGPLPPALARRVRRVVLRRAEDLEAALALADAELEVPLSRAAEDLARRAAARATARTVVTVPGRGRLSEVLALDPPPAALAGLPAGVRAEGFAPCLAAGAVPPRPALDAATLRAEGGLDLLPWAERWVEREARTRSLRCVACADAGRCPGAPVNHVRAFGFGWMQPRAAAGG